MQSIIYVVSKSAIFEPLVIFFIMQGLFSNSSLGLIFATFIKVHIMYLTELSTVVIFGILVTFQFEKLMPTKLAGAKHQ